MNQFTQKYTGTIRSTGWLMNGIGIGVVFGGSDWVRSADRHDLFILGLLVILIGNVLRAARTEEEKEKESQKKNNRYSWLIERFGVNIVKSTYKVSIISTVALFCIAMSIMFSGSMNYVWPLIALIAIALVMTTFTHEPNPTSRS